MRYMEMVHANKLFWQVILAILVCAVLASPAWAMPPLPASFYGTVKVSGQNVPDGTLVRALIGGQPYAQGYTQTYQGNTVYALNIPGDDSETARTDGGRDGDAIRFEIGGVLATQTGSWKSGTNVELNLSVSTVTPLADPQPTPTGVPTQTPIIVEQAAPTVTQAVPTAAPTATDKPAAQPPAPTPTGQPVSANAAPALPSPATATTAPATDTAAPATTPATAAATQAPPSPLPAAGLQPSATPAALAQASAPQSSAPQSPAGEPETATGGPSTGARVAILAIPVIGILAWLAAGRMKHKSMSKPDQV